MFSLNVLFLVKIFIQVKVKSDASETSETSEKSEKSKVIL
jgi:hypothetical protein